MPKVVIIDVFSNSGIIQNWNLWNMWMQLRLLLCVFYWQPLSSTIQVNPMHVDYPNYIWKKTSRKYIKAALIYHYIKYMRQKTILEKSRRALSSTVLIESNIKQALTAWNPEGRLLVNSMAQEG